MKYLYTGLLCSLLWAGLQAQTMRMVAIGSSTTAGQGTWPIDSSWVQRFNFHYKYELNMVDSTYNLGVGGYTCYKGMPGSYTAPPGRDGSDPNKNVTKAVNLLAGLPASANGVVIVNFPTNGYVTYSIAEVMTCLQTIYDSATRFGNLCFITTTQPRTDGSFATPAMKRKLADIKDSILNRFGTGHTINFWDGMYNTADTTILSAYSAGDNIHFNNAGHRILYQRVLAKNIFGALLKTGVNGFDAIRRNKDIVLQWKAQVDDAHTVFIIERSSDDRSFEKLIIVPSNVTTTALTYSFTDTRPLPGKNYYRLTIKEGNQYTYSKTISITNEASELSITKIYPVPAKADIQLEMQAIKAQPITVRILSAAGVPLLQYARVLVCGNNKLPLVLGNLPKGIYFIETHTSKGEKLIQSFTR